MRGRQGRHAHERVGQAAGEVGGLRVIHGGGQESCSSSGRCQGGLGVGLRPVVMAVDLLCCSSGAGATPSLSRWWRLRAAVKWVLFLRVQQTKCRGRESQSRWEWIGGFLNVGVFGLGLQDLSIGRSLRVEGAYFSSSLGMTHGQCRVGTQWRPGGLVACAHLECPSQGPD